MNAPPAFDLLGVISECSEELLTAKAIAQAHLEVHQNTITDLDELGDIMTEMLDRQQVAEVRLLAYPMVRLTHQVHRTRASTTWPSCTLSCSHSRNYTISIHLISMHTTNLF